MNQTETHTYSTEETTTPLHFWRNPITWRSTNTGLNENVISTYAPHTSKQDIIRHMRLNIDPYTDGRKFLNESSFSRHKDYFADVVNECMDSIWSKERGFVFNEAQLREVMKILPTVNVRWNDNDGCYWCWK